MKKSELDLPALLLGFQTKAAMMMGSGIQNMMTTTSGNSGPLAAQTTPGPMPTPTQRNPGGPTPGPTVPNRTKTAAIPYEILPFLWHD